MIQSPTFAKFAFGVCVFARLMMAYGWTQALISLENEIANHDSEHRIEKLNRRGGPLSSRSVQSACNDVRRPIKARAEHSSAYNLSKMSKVAMEMDSSNLNRRRVCHNVCLMVLTFFPIVLLLSISQLLFTTIAANWDPALG